MKRVGVSELREHGSIPLQVWVDIDEGIADAVIFINSIPGARTFGSCQGSIGEGGHAPYEPYVLASWPESAQALIESRFVIGKRGIGWAYLQPRVAKKEQRRG